MASKEHLELSEFIKSVHTKLRERCKTVGPQEAWTEHCKNEEDLRQYASAMQTLAINVWDQNYTQNTKERMSRNQWIIEMCKNYFYGEKQVEYQRNRETTIANKMDLKLSDQTCYNLLDEHPPKIKVLDVGSCYNPFKICEFFEVFAIDIAPAHDEVYKCDFLNVKTDNSPQIIIKNEIKSLLINSFDVVIFSLLLEYLPSPSQRLMCCEKAYKLLKTEGILIIVTPDSNHVGTNAKLMISWRHILAKMGFSRIKYEKLKHIHCMAFRKSLRIKIAARWSDINKESQVYDEILIPQDINNANKVL